MGDTRYKITIGAVNPWPGTSMNTKTGTWRSMRPNIDLERCIKCYLCHTYCPDASIVKTEKGPVVDYDYCKGCGICASECPVKCIEMVPEEK